METRAGYVAVGAFVLVVLAGILVATLWLARVQFETGYQYFETHVAGQVSGLGVGAPVRLNGIEVGRVANIELDPEDPKLVTLLLQVHDAIQIRADAVASVETQGLTGVSYVEISGGTLSSPLLTAAAGHKYPEIASRPSSLQEVFDSAPELLARLLVIADRLESVLDDKNRSAIAETLINMRDTTGVLDRRTLAADLDSVVQASRPSLHDLTTNGTAQLDELLSDARRLAASLNRVSTGLERNPSELLLVDRREGYQPK